MAITAGEASKLFQVKLAGDKDFLIEGVGDPRTATTHAACFIAHQKYLATVSQSQAKCWIIDPRFYEALDEKSKSGRTFLLSQQPYLTFIKLVNHFFPLEKAKPKRSEQAYIDKTATVDPSCQIEPFAYVGAGAIVGPRVILHPGVWIGDHASVGEESILYSGVKIYPNSVVGKRNILHTGCVIGSDGFGFVPDKDIQIKVPQVGRTITHDDVEIGANTTIDRGAFGDTVIGQGTKIDNLVQIGHNCVVGKNCILCAFVGLSGNTTLGDNVLMAGQAGTKGHLKIGDRVNIGAQSGITKDVPSGSDIKGYPPQSVKNFLKNQALYLKLPDFYKRLLRLEKKVGVESEDSVE